MPESANSTRPQARVVAAIENCFRTYIPPAAPVCVAYSGGVDSSVLLHALSRSTAGRPVRAVHVDHGLHPQSGAWAATCQQIGRNLQIPVTVVAAKVDRSAGRGLEAAAREARYAALAEQLEQREVLLTAHHQRDQLETLMLRLLRGTGVHGLAAMSAHTRRGPIELLRPLLYVPADIVRAYAVAEQMAWVDDPSNADSTMDRNFLRHNVLPTLLERWPSAEGAVTRAARLCAQAVRILDEVAAQDLAGVLDGDRLRLDPLFRLSPERQRNAARHALHLRGLAIPSEKQLEQALATMASAASDSQPEVAWPGVRIRRYRQHLWLYAEELDPRLASPPAEIYSWDPAVALNMGRVRGTLRSEPATGCGVATRYCAGPLEVKFRRGGERLRIARRGRTQELKNLLQETGIVPWMRGHIPLLYSGDRLVAVADLWVNADYAAQDGATGVAVKWEGHSPVR